MPTEKSSDKMLTVIFAFIALGSFCVNLCGYTMTTGVTVLFQSMQGSTFYAGVSAAIFSIAAGIARLGCGAFIDSVGRFKVAVIGALLLMAGSLAPAIYATTGTIMVARVLQGIGFAAANTTLSTMAADALPLSRMGEGIGYYGLATAVAMTIGPSIGLMLGSSNVYLFASVAVMAFFTLAFSLMCNYEKHPERLPRSASYRRRLDEEAANAAEAAGNRTAATDTPKRSLIPNIFVKTALPAAVIMLFYAPSTALAGFFIGLYGTDLGIQNAGIYYTLAAISMIVVRLAGKAFMDTVDPRVVFSIASAIGAISFALLLGAPAIPLLYYVSGLLYGVMTGVSFPLLLSIGVKATNPERWGAANALVLLSYDVGMAISSPIWGIMHDELGFPISIACAAGACILSIIVTWIATSRQKR